MTRNTYFGLAVLVIVGTAAIFFLRTPQMSNKAEFGGVSLNIDYATTEAERERGLGGRTNVPDNYGMLFIFPEDGYYGFWMKDTLVPLDMFWLDSKGRVVSIVREVATSSYPYVFYPSMRARFVLETSAGFADAHSIATGTPLRLNFLPTVSE